MRLPTLKAAAVAGALVIAVGGGVALGVTIASDDETASPATTTTSTARPTTTTRPPVTTTTDPRPAELLSTTERQEICDTVTRADPVDALSEGASDRIALQMLGDRIGGDPEALPIYILQDLADIGFDDDMAIYRRLLHHAFDELAERCPSEAHQLELAAEEWVIGYVDEREGR